MVRLKSVPKILRTLIIIAVVVAVISGIMLVQSANASELEGEIVGLTSDSTGAVTSIVIAGQTIVINSDTEIEGVPANGGLIKVKYVETDGTLIALEIEVEDDEEDIDDDEDEMEIEGTIKEVITDGNDNVSGIVIDGKTILINEGTEVEGILAEDTMVEVEYAVDGDGSLVALEIEAEDDEDDDDDRDDNHSDEDDDDKADDDELDDED